MYWYVSDMGHVMRRDDRVPGLHVHLPPTAGQVRVGRETKMKMSRAKSGPRPLPLSTFPPPHSTPHMTAWVIYKLWPFSPSFHCHWKKIRWGRLLWTSNITQLIRHSDRFQCSLLCRELSGCIYSKKKRGKKHSVCLPRVHPLRQPLTFPVSLFHSQLMLTGM